MKKIYIACPYSSELESVRELRFQLVCKKTAELMEQGYNVFSPISHSHPVSKYTKTDACDSEFWIYQDLPLLEWADELWIYKLKGWENSKGIKKEIEYAKRLGKQIKYIS